MAIAGKQIESELFKTCITKIYKISSLKLHPENLIKIVFFELQDIKIRHFIFRKIGKIVISRNNKL